MEVLNGGQMNNIFINDSKFEINKDDFAGVCENLKKRIIKILYLKEDFLSNRIEEYDVKSYIKALTWDLYGAYVIFENFKFLNAICELEGIKENLLNDFVRKKVLDLASYITSISDIRE
jgi:hypothetical protein